MAFHSLIRWKSILVTIVQYKFRIGIQWRFHLQKESVPFSVMVKQLPICDRSSAYRRSCGFDFLFITVSTVHTSYNLYYHRCICSSIHLCNFLFHSSRNCVTKSPGTILGSRTVNVCNHTFNIFYMSNISHNCIHC